MALFWNNYSKEGPGVDPDEPEKGPIVGFFSNYFSKFWRICGLGMLATLGSIITLALLYFVGFYFMPMLFPAFSMDNLITSIEALKLPLADGVDALNFASTLYIVTHFIFIATIFALQFFVTGPVHAAVTYIMRNFARRDPVFFWSDLRDAVKANWKQSLIHSLFTAIVLSLIVYGYYFYGQILETGFLLYFVRSVMVMLLVFLSIMQFYIYQMMVTFDLCLKDMYKNALILAFAKLPTNLLILAILIFMGFIIPIYGFWSFPSQGSFLLVTIYLIAIFIGFAYFLINFFANRGIKKYLLDNNDDDEGGNRSHVVADEEVEDSVYEEIQSEDEVSSVDDSDGRIATPI